MEILYVSCNSFNLSPNKLNLQSIVVVGIVDLVNPLSDPASSLSSCVSPIGLSPFGVQKVPYLFSGLLPMTAHNSMPSDHSLHIYNR